MGILEGGRGEEKGQVRWRKGGREGTDQMEEKGGGKEGQGRKGGELRNPSSPLVFPSQHPWQTEKSICNISEALTWILTACLCGGGRVGCHAGRGVIHFSGEGKKIWPAIAQESPLVSHHPRSAMAPRHCWAITAQAQLGGYPVDVPPPLPPPWSVASPAQNPPIP